MIDAEKYRAWKKGLRSLENALFADCQVATEPAIHLPEREDDAHARRVAMASNWPPPLPGCRPRMGRRFTDEGIELAFIAGCEAEARHHRARSDFTQTRDLAKSAIDTAVMPGWEGTRDVFVDYLRLLEERDSMATPSDGMGEDSEDGS